MLLSFYWVDIFDTFFKYTAPITLLIFIIKYLIDKYDEKAKKKKDHWNNFHYFETIVSLIMDLSIKQLEYYDEYIRKLRDEPTNNQQLTIVINESLKRLVNKFDQEKYFHSFSKQFKKKHQARAKEIFLAIYNRLDLYLKSYKNAIKISDKLILAMNIWDKEYTSVIAKKMNPELREVESTLKAVNFDLFKKFEKHIIAYTNSNKKNTDFQNHIIDILLSEEHFYTSPIFNNLINSSSEIKAIYTNMVNASNFQANQITTLKDDLVKYLNEINTLRKEYEELLKK